MYRSRIIFFIILICLIGIGLKMRREIPSQDIVALDRGIAVINGENVNFSNLLEVKINLEENFSKKYYYNKKGICYIEGLINGQKYKLEIRRKDLKGIILYKPLKIEIVPRGKGSKYIVLVGASVGKMWEFNKILNRLSLKDDFVLGFRAIYDFDKTKVINELLELPINPTAVILKECAAYFPRDLEQSKKLIKKWVNQLKIKGITPILATVVPVTKEHDVKHPNRQKTLEEFNDFLRLFANQSQIPLMDLEKVLRVSEKERYLKFELAQSDGLHLNKRGYDAIDQVVLTVLSNI